MKFLVALLIALECASMLIVAYAGISGEIHQSAARAFIAVFLMLIAISLTFVFDAFEEN